MTEDDFGFSMVDTQELVSPDIEALHAAYRDRMRSVIAMITPLLDNLKANPEKDYIFWPGRVEKVTEFSDRLVELAFREVTLD